MFILALKKEREKGVGATVGSSMLAVAKEADMQDLKVYELKAICRARGLKVSGRKAELIARVMSSALEEVVSPPGADAGAPP